MHFRKENTCITITKCPEYLRHFYVIFWKDTLSTRLCTITLVQPLLSWERDAFPRQQVAPVPRDSSVQNCHGAPWGGTLTHLHFLFLAVN